MSYSALLSEKSSLPLSSASACGASAVRRNVAILGFGTVGTSVAKILCSRGLSGLHLQRIFNRNVECKRTPWIPRSVHWTENFEDLLSPDIHVVLELVGGVDPAGKWVRRALLAGKSVVTANKQLIAHHGPELTQLAHEKGCQLLFGAAVAGGVPVIAGLEQGLCGDRLYKLCGILNGTCNYILSKMDEGMRFSSALAKAQELGYAESDPTDDLEGYDARAKLIILARTAFRAEVDPSEVACRSISSVASIDFAYARELSCTIRQISQAEVKRKKLFASVQPMLAPLVSPLARAQGSENVVIASGKYGGDTVFSGYGAGGDPTAVAVVSDLLAIAQNHAKQSNHHAWCRRYPVDDDPVSRHYIRFVVKDRPGIVATIGQVLAAYGISIDAVIQKPGYPKSRLPFVVTLEPCRASVLGSALTDLGKVNFLVGTPLDLQILGSS